MINIISQEKKKPVRRVATMTNGTTFTGTATFKETDGVTVTDTGLFMVTSDNSVSGRQDWAMVALKTERYRNPYFVRGQQLGAITVENCILVDLGVEITKCESHRQ